MIASIFKRIEALFRRSPRRGGPEFDGATVETLDEVSLYDHWGIERLLDRVAGRDSESITDDEIIRFVDRNRLPILAGSLEPIERIAHASEDDPIVAMTAATFTTFLARVSAQVTRCPPGTEGDTEGLVRVMSFLSRSVSSGDAEYAVAVRTLGSLREDLNFRGLSLSYVLYEYSNGYGTPSQLPSEFIMLVIECAIIAANVNALRDATAMLAHVNPPRDGAAVIDLLERSRDVMIAHGWPTETIDDDLKRYRTRFSGGGSDDVI